jgi:hypothetical protein
MILNQCGGVAQIETNPNNLHWIKIRKYRKNQVNPLHINVKV